VNRLHSSFPRTSSRVDPAALLDVTTMFVVTGAAAAIVLSPQGFVLPMFATIMMAGGGFLAFYAWRRGMPQEKKLSVWDVSGSLLALGFCAAVFSDNEQIAKLVSL
jgi:hypothetical protein